MRLIRPHLRSALSRPRASHRRVHITAAQAIPLRRRIKPLSRRFGRRIIEKQLRAAGREEYEYTMKTGRQRKTRDRSAAKQPGGIPPDPVIEHYKRDIDGTLLIENLKLTVEERFIRLMRLQEFAEELRRAGRRQEPGRD